MEAMVLENRASIGKKALALGVATFAAGMMVLAAPADEALAYSGTQTDATTSSVTATLELGDYYMSQNPEMLYVEAAPSGSSAYEPVHTSVLTPTEMVVEGLEPATEYTMRVNFTYANGKYESSSYVYDLCTVAEKINSLAITSFYPYSKIMQVGFANPGAIYGFEVEMDAFAGKKYDKTVKKSWNYAQSYSTVVESDSLKINLKTAYKARVRTYVLMGDGTTKKWSEWSDNTVLVPEPMINAKYTYTSSGVKITWPKCSGAKNYTVYGSTKDGSYKKIATTSGTSMKITKIKGAKLKKGKQYYLYVQANVPSGGKTYKSYPTRVSYFTY